jgi:hypothetical protein
LVLSFLTIQEHKNKKSMLLRNERTIQETTRIQILLFVLFFLTCHNTKTIARREKKRR